MGGIVLELHRLRLCKIDELGNLLTHVQREILGRIDVVRDLERIIPVVADAAAVEGGRAHVLRIPVVTDFRHRLVVPEGVRRDAGHFDFPAPDDQGPGDFDGTGIAAAGTKLQLLTLRVLVAVAVPVRDDAGVGIQGTARSGLRLRIKGGRRKQRHGSQD